MMMVVPVKVQIYNEADELYATVEMFDDCSFELKLPLVMTPETWDELKAAIDKAVVSMFDPQA
jgi:hypothetical protein